MEPASPVGTMAQELWHPGKSTKLDRVIQSTARKCTPMEVLKQPEHGRVWTTEEQKCSSLQMNYD